MAMSRNEPACSLKTETDIQKLGSKYMLGVKKEPLEMPGLDRQMA